MTREKAVAHKNRQSMSGQPMPDPAQGEVSDEISNRVKAHDSQALRNPPNHEGTGQAPQQAIAAQDHDLPSAPCPSQVAAAQDMHPTPGSEVSVPAWSVRRSVQACVALFWLTLALPACAELRLGRIDARTAGLLEFIGALEAPGGYDAYSHYAAAPPPKPLTTMTVNEVLAWQERIDARSRSEAAGRFQIMEDTLRDYLVPTMGLTGEERFSPGMQDAMAVALMRRRGWDPDSQALVAMGNALALEWAALPLLSGPRAGQSAHRNAKGVRNRALTTPEVFLAVLKDPTRKDVVTQTRQRGTTKRIAGSRVTRVETIRRTSTRPYSPKGITGGPLTPSRIIRFRIDPYAQE